MSAPIPTRRGMLAAIGMAPLVAVGAAGTPAAAASSDLSRLIAVATAARQRSEAFYDDVVEPADAAWRIATGLIPHEECGTYESISGTSFTLSTARPSEIAIARGVMRDPFWASRDSDYHNGCRRLLAAADAREAERERLRGAHRIDEINAEYERLAVAYWQAERAAIDYPAASLAELARKIAYIETVDAADDPATWPVIAADVRWLAGGRA